MSTLEALRDWSARMRQRTFRQFELQGATPAGWHVLLPDGDFGFLDVTMPTTAEERAVLVQEARDYMREMHVPACLFTMERELEDGRPALVCQFEAVDGRGRRERAVQLYPIATTDDGRHVDALHELEPTVEADVELQRFGVFPDVLPDPPSPLRIL